MSNIIVTANDYQVLAMRTAPQLGMIGDLQHAQMGLTTEVGEFVDPLKRHVIYGKELDTVNMREELGDMLWYIALAATAIGADMHTLMHENIEKLQKRFPKKFTQEEALARADKIEPEDFNLPQVVLDSQGKEVANWGLTKEQLGSN